MLVAGFVLAELVLTTNAVLAQQTPGSSVVYERFVHGLRTDFPTPKTTYYKIERNSFTSILPPQEFLKGRQNPNLRRAATANFIVSYNGFSPEAQKAFQYALDIWANLIASPVPIRVQANWTVKNRGILGSAGPSQYRAGQSKDEPGGRQKAYGIYPIALAEKIARRDLNDPNSPDISADFNSDNNWYYGLDGKTPAGQTDLVSVVMHEIGHGLGFIGYFNVNGTNGQYSAGGYSSVYDQFIENALGKRLTAETATYPDNSNLLFQQLTGGNLFLNGPILQQKTKQKAKLYAPATFDLGSSIYHLDESTYPKGDTNSLMTPQLGNAEAIHSPGPLVLNFFSDIEWKTTSVLHVPLVSSEVVSDVIFNVSVVSDTTLIANSVKLFYRKTAPTSTDTKFTEIAPTLVSGSTTYYTYTMPASVAQGDVWYYFQAQDASGRTFTNPGKSPANAQLLHYVQLGPDITPPTVRFSPPKNFIFNTSVSDSLPINAYIADDRQPGVASAVVEYQINGVAQPSVALRYGRPVINQATYDSIYSNRITFPANSLKAGDKITYRIVARDSSRTKNQSVSPKTGFYELNVVATNPALDRYTNTFKDAATASDFVGYQFGIIQPTGFADPAIHSAHPYQNGSDFKYESNYEYVLLSPIRLKANPDSATIRFDEIVLVEPGDNGSKFGDANFYDYVIVEGSADNGRTWKPLIDGYDSNNQVDWFIAYNGNLVNGSTAQDKNSAAVGTPTLFKRRQIGLLGNGNFRAGDQILIRFRLFADQLAHGWGWAIDNLQIQIPPPPPVLATEPITTGTFSVYPNPVSNGLVRVEADFVKPVSEASLTITAATGQAVRQMMLKVGSTKLTEQLDLSQLPTGLYFLRLNAGDAVLTQKLVIAR